MSGAASLRALMALLTMGWRRAVAERVGLIGRILLYGLVLLIFQGVWRGTPLRETPGFGFDEDQLLWYVAVTEWIVFAMGYPYRGVEADILKGRLAWLAARPIAYTWAIAAEWAGETAFRLAVLGVFGFIVTWAATGSVTPTVAEAPWIVLAGLLAVALGFAMQVSVGLIAVWLRTAAPIWWVTQKLFFVLGGLLLPLPIYPALLRAFAEWSPFAAMLYWPASLVFDGEGGAVSVILRQLAWLAILGALAAVASEAAIRRIQRIGD